MEKFHQISTESFKPISYDNKYLFDSYEQTANFLHLTLGTDSNGTSYKNILAKPVIEKPIVEWFSPFSGMRDVRHDESLSAFAYFKYYEFLDKINAKIEEFKRTNDSDKRNWAGILDSIFNKQDNLIFSNGEDISIVWGWEFNNNSIYRPSFAPDKPLAVEEHEPEPEEVEEEIDTVPESLPVGPEPVEIVEVITEKEPLPEKKMNFLEFLKWFASRYWWLLLVLLVLIALVFTFKSLMYS